MPIPARLAGLPPSSWLLLLAAVGIGLLVELRFYVLNRPGRGSAPRRGPDA